MLFPNFLWIPASAADGDTVDLNDNIILLANAVSIFIVHVKPTFIKYLIVVFRVF